MASTVPNPCPTNKGKGTYSYATNSYYQRSCANLVKGKLEEAIAEKLDVTSLPSASETIRLVDFGCASGPNSIAAMEQIIKAIKLKRQTQCPNSPIPQFQVFLNDQLSNDFNTLFTYLPRSNKDYFSAGVPGSFHDQLFPNASIHFAYSACALHWLSRVPEQVSDEKSGVWNKGRVHYANASEEVYKAYAAQFSKDMKSFLVGRAKEVLVGGMVVMLIPANPDELPHHLNPTDYMYDLMGSAFMDMVKEGLINEAQVDSFNLPYYSPSPTEIEKLVKENGSFSIEKMESENPSVLVNGRVDIRVWVMHVRAAIEGWLLQHFEAEVVDGMFGRLVQKLTACSDYLHSICKNAIQLFVVLKRK